MGFGASMFLAVYCAPEGQRTRPEKGLPGYATSGYPIIKFKRFQNLYTTRSIITNFEVFPSSTTYTTGVA